MLSRQRVTTVVFITMGAALLAFSLRLEAGDWWFYPATFGLAVLWTVGSFAAGPVHLGRMGNEPSGRRPVVLPFLTGLGLAALFVMGALVVRQIDFLSDAVSNVISHADEGSQTVLLVITFLSGLAEELFFRGAVYDAVPRHRVVVTTIVYSVVTLLTGNVMLAFAAVLLGAVAGWQRERTGGVLAPMITHVTWSVSMLYALPLLFP
ncbi:CPBP family glutamic-type intramembrane protease [Nocardioides pacificus]